MNIVATLKRKSVSKGIVADNSELTKIDPQGFGIITNPYYYNYTLTFFSIIHNNIFYILTIYLFFRKLIIALRSGINTQIDYISMHGHRQHHHFAEDSIGYGEIQFVVDPKSQTVFWLDSDEDKIEFTDYDGSIRHLFRTFLHNPVSMALLNEDVIWTSLGTRDIYWTHRSNLASVKKFTIEKLPYMSVPDVIPIVASSPQLILDHPCLHDNGGCSHVCIAAGKKSVYCLCPAGLVYKDHQNKTCIELLDCEFRCNSGECTTMSRRCNGHKDCVDGSDEADCSKQKGVTCKLNEFTCHNEQQCIKQDLRCDKHPDCEDKSDEENCEHYGKEYLTLEIFQANQCLSNYQTTQRNVIECSSYAIMDDVLIHCPYAMELMIAVIIRTRHRFVKVEIIVVQICSDARQDNAFPNNGNVMVIWTVNQVQMNTINVVSIRIFRVSFRKFYLFISNNYLRCWKPEARSFMYEKYCEY